jgi:hypothetical protein
MTVVTTMSVSGTTQQAAEHERTDDGERRRRQLAHARAEGDEALERHVVAEQRELSREHERGKNRVGRRAGECAARAGEEGMHRQAMVQAARPKLRARRGRSHQPLRRSARPQRLRRAGGRAATA